MPDIAYINGRFCDPSEAFVSINDRGFQYADSVYEVIVAYNGIPFKMSEHLRRLHRSLELMDMSIGEDSIDIASMLTNGILRSRYEECMAYLQISRGVQIRSHVYRDDLIPTIVATFRQKPRIDESIRSSGIGVVTVADTRRAVCEIKATGLMPNILELNRARRRGFHDAIFVGRGGDVREATSSNVFAVKNGVLITPETSESILHGITREFILECAAKANVPSKELRLVVSDLEQADEVFLSSTTVDILPVTIVNESAIGNGNPGPVSATLAEVFQAEIHQLG